MSSALIFILKGTVLDITENLFLFTTGLAISSDIKMIDFHFSFPFYIPMIMAVFFTVFFSYFCRQVHPKHYQQITGRDHERGELP